jgi:hypothetical protein
MNKHTKAHSQQLNIKTTQLASLTAVFHSKKRPPPAEGSAPTPGMGMDEAAHPPEQDSQMDADEVVRPPE